MEWKATSGRLTGGAGGGGIADQAVAVGRVALRGVHGVHVGAHMVAWHVLQTSFNEW